MYKMSGCVGVCLCVCVSGCVCEWTVMCDVWVMYVCVLHVTVCV